MELKMEDLLVGKYMSEYPISVKPDVSLKEAIDFMADNRFATLIVMEEEGTTPLGILTEREILHQIASGADWKGKKIGDITLRQFVSVTPDTTVLGAARLMISKRARVLVFADGDKLVGTITASDMLKAFSQTKKSPPLEDVVSKKVYHCPYDTSILDASKLMEEKNIGSILVERDSEFGIFTQRDLVRALSKDARLSDQVGTYSSFPLVTAKMGTSATEAAAIMASQSIKRLGLTEGVSIAGIVTARDLVDAFQAAKP